MATIGYNYAVQLGSQNLSPSVTGTDPAIAALSNGNWVAGNTLTTVAPAVDVIGSIRNPVGTTVTGNGQLNTTSTNDQKNLDLAGLTGGGWVATFEDYSTGTAIIRGRILTNSGASLGNDFDISTTAGQSGAQTAPDSAGLTNGNFVVVWQDEDSVSDHDIIRATYSPTGTLLSAVAVEGSGNDALKPVVAALSGGGYAVAWHRLTLGGNTEIWTAVYNADSTMVKAASVFDNGGTLNRNVAIAATPDGGFVLAYEDMDWTAEIEITLAKFSATGVFVNWVDGSTNANSAQIDPTLAVFDNGMIALGYTNYDPTPANQTTNVRLFTSALVNTSAINAWGNSENSLEFAALANGRLVTVEQDTGGSNLSQYSIVDFTRTTTGDGTDEILGGDSFRDVINGAGGNDFILSSGGADTTDGGTGFNSMSWLNETQGALVNLTNQSLNAFGAAGDSVANFSAYYLTNFGDSFTNTTTGGYIYGYAGDDIIIGGTGSDFMDGGTGADNMNGNGGFDYVSYASSAAAVTINMTNQAANVGDAAGDLISNTEAFYLSANSDTFIGQNGQNIVFAGGGSDLLIGGTNASDWLFGEAGVDFLSGGTFDDLLSGGSGADTFAFNSWVGNGFDSILDFVPGEDKIQLGAAGFGLPSGQQFFGGINFFAAASPFATQAMGTLLYATGLGILYYDPDGSGANGAIALAQFTGAPTLTVTDFIVV